MIGALLLIAATAPLPEFEFKGFRPGQPITETTLKFSASNCTPMPNDNAVECFLYGRVDGRMDSFGGVSIKSTTVRTDAYERFYRMEMKFVAAQFPQAIEALSAKFGEPCGRSSGTVQNRLGATFPSSRVEYCLAGGKMTVIERAGGIYDGLIVYEDSRFVPPKKPARIDF